MNHNIGQTLKESARAYPEHMGLVCRRGQGYRSWTFKEMDLTADWFAGRLADLGIRKGDRVMLMVKPSLAFITLTFALFRIGAIIILIDPGMGYRNLLRCIGRVQPDVFIGIAKAHLFKTFFPQPFRTVRLAVCIGPSYGLFRPSLIPEKAKKSPVYGTPFPAAAVQADDPAAILFTTGSTGPPKGVRYDHGTFQAQLKLIKEYYRIGPEDIDQPAFPLFALFSAALGACSVIPDMNPARPARVEPAKFVATIMDNGVTYSFGSPAIWHVVSRYCREQGITLPSVQKVLMAGAPVAGDLLAQTAALLPPGAEIHTPYGATEALPVASITAKEILADTWQHTRNGKGFCVGRPLPSIILKIIKVIDGPINSWDEALLLPDYAIGEIAVKGPVVTRGYADNAGEDRLAKIADGEGFWHRMGDLGYLDRHGRLWFCGRKNHRVVTVTVTMYTVCCEAFFNEHPALFRSALVGVGPVGSQLPVLLVELREKSSDTVKLLAELRDIAGQNEMTRPIQHILIHPGFPVDIRHNAKIFREKLALWAARKLAVQGGMAKEQP